MAEMWQCRPCAPGEFADPATLPADGWVPAAVPGTAALAVGDDGRDFDSSDWWFRGRIETERDGPHLLFLDGLATVADVWADGVPVLHSESMFARHAIRIEDVPGGVNVAIRFAALTPLLAARRPRPRWKTRLVANQNLRWFRTMLLGRIPGWAPGPAAVGPWRPIRLEPIDPVAVRRRRLEAHCEGTGGRVDISVTLATDGSEVGPVTAQVGEVTTELSVRRDGTALHAEGTVQLRQVERWWPNGYGAQPRYGVRLHVAGRQIALGRVGFRELRAERDDGGFQLVVNDVPVFCRGACWVPGDLGTLTSLRDAGLTMVRITGTTAYEDAAFWDTCDALGLLVWQDLMFANLDPPDDDEFRAVIEDEIDQLLDEVCGRPSLALICGGSEVEQQAGMLGLAAERRHIPLLHEQIPKLLADLVPEVPYVTNSPTGGTLPFRVDVGVAHYFGVGAYQRPFSDARTSGVRFASECLAFAIPPEAEAVEKWFGAASGAGHHPAWKAGVPRDSGTSWDFEDVRDAYVHRLFDVDPRALRFTDPARALDLGRAAVVEAMTAVFSEWRRPGSRCAGGLVIAARDLRPGAGWGVLDAAGVPKAPWWALRRVLAPVALLLTDEGLNGLRAHVVNDTAEEVQVTVRVELFSGERLHESAERAVLVPARGGVSLDAEDVLDGFRDVTWAFRFGPCPYDVVAVSLLDEAGRQRAQSVFLPGGFARPQELSVGLAATAQPAGDGAYRLTVTAQRFAQYVTIDVPGFRPDDSWFHVPPGAARTLTLRPIAGATGGSGEVRALNSAETASVTLSDGTPGGTT